jgi:flagellar motility protein MotE (MotC chaperone)
MKKCLFVFQVAVILFFIVKLAALGGILQNPFIENTLAAAEKRLNIDTPTSGAVQPAQPAPETTDDNLAKPRDILTALETKKKELDQKEQFLKSEEQRLLALKKEILDKIDLLQAEKEKLDAIAKSSQVVENKKYKDLAKVYDETPAAKAGAMLEQLDVKTAAGITMNMKRDKAGMIWGYLSPHKAIEITREITRSGKQ